jgi:tRNA G18 (ribose-2'-O)-methylase SpoU
VIPIDDLDDPRLDDYRNVPDPELLEERGVFVAEGRFVVARLLEGRRFQARSVLVTETARAALDTVLAARPDVPVFVVPPRLIDAITGLHIHRGCLAIGERPAPASWQALVRGTRRLIVLERVGNADNIGGVFRNAAAFGADGVLLGPACADPLYRKAIRTSMGAALSVPFARLDTWPDDLGVLRAHGTVVIAMTPSASDDIRTVVAALPSGASVALLFGHEGDGLTSGALEAATHRAAIPMAPYADSLNVATAAAIALYELARDRQADTTRRA